MCQVVSYDCGNIHVFRELMRQLKDTITVLIRINARRLFLKICYFTGVYFITLDSTSKPKDDSATQREVEGKNRHIYNSQSV